MTEILESIGCLAPASYFLERKEKHRKTVRKNITTLADADLEVLRKAETKRMVKQLRNLKHQPK